MMTSLSLQRTIARWVYLTAIPALSELGCAQLSSPRDCASSVKHQRTGPGGETLFHHSGPWHPTHNIVRRARPTGSRNSHPHQHDTRTWQRRVEHHALHLSAKHQNQIWYCRKTFEMAGFATIDEQSLEQNPLPIAFSISPS
jgi:hypothetical protein